jgi:hypothetical protein
MEKPEVSNAYRKYIQAHCGSASYFIQVKGFFDNPHQMNVRDRQLRNGGHAGRKGGHTNKIGSHWLPILIL